MLDKEGKINAIIALQCMCTGIHFKEKVVSDVKSVLPDTKVVIKQAKAMARAKARISAKESAEKTLEREKESREELREEREGLAAVLVPIVLGASAIWIGLTAMVNVRERRGEIAVLRAVGLRAYHILSLFLSKAVMIGILGGAIGYGAGFLAGRYLEVMLSNGGGNPVGAAALFQPGVLALALILAPCLAAAATFIPATLAAYQDPADILSEE
jgi:ABC-type antimicrobial peptide transport system permease subunit